MPELPTGTVTFLFTDIEGSTNVARALGPRWSDVLEDHNGILRVAIRDRGGIDLRTQGDAFFAVFTSAVDAVTACVEAQRALAEHPWPPDGSIRVRMGMHTGEGRLGGDDYVGLDVHRAARIVAAGHGGQVLLSETTTTLADHDLPEGVSLRGLGTHRLKDFDEPQPIHQLVIEGLPDEFPALKTLEIPTNLPLALTTFVGRERELEELQALLARNRLVTLAGPGGTGKTRLALEAARRRTVDHRDGVFFVDLSPIRDPGLVASSIAQSLGLKERPHQTALATVMGHLRERSALLILDNFEQVAAAAPIVAELIQASPRTHFLVTSRVRLSLSGEQEFPVPPLGLPVDGSDVRSLAGNEAVGLFADRARSAQPSFEISDENAATIAEICARLDGLPLAIELAAAQLRVLSPQELLARLDQRLPLRAGAGNVPERQRTLRGAIEWSYGLLDEPQQRLFARLSVFAGGASFGTVEAVCNPAGDLGGDTLDVLGSLVDQSLVRRGEDPEGSRYLMLETIREFAGERLHAEFDLDGTERRHAEVFAALAEEWGPAVRGQDGQRAVAILTAEQDNMRAALGWASRADRAQTGFRIVGALWMFWVERGRVAEGRGLAAGILALPSGSRRDGLRAGATSALAALAYWTADYPSAGAAYRETADIYNEMGNAHGHAEAVKNLAYVALAERDTEAVFAIVEQAMDAARTAGDPALTAEIAGVLGTARAQVRDFEGAIEALQESLKLFEATASGDRWPAEIRGRLANVYRMAGRLDEAEDVLRSSLRAYRDDFVSSIGTAVVLIQLAAIAMVRGNHERALRLAAFCNATAERTGSEPPPAILMAPDFSEFRAAAAETLDEEAIDRMWAEGRAMAAEEAISLALGEPR
jgi:predicted ATPase/class 3 adenylate cyclase